MALKIISVTPPNLPTPPPAYNVVYENQVNNILRLFFNSLANTVNSGIASSTVNGIFNATFQSGYVQYVGPNGTFLSNINMIFGLNLPNPSGVPGPALLLGSGGGQGIPANFWIITDQAYDSATPGNNLGITAGETQPSGTANGGLLELFGGASFGGTGGGILAQGGTSAHGQGGPVTVAGGNNTDGTQPAGDVFIIGGQTGSVGANVQLIMTQINGVSGVVRIRVNSTPLIDFFPDGSIYLWNGGGFGTAGQHITSQGPGLPVKWA